jgi:DNA-directed RNA polymerase subunit RPC12/RpoP
VRALELLKDMANSGECRHELRGELMVFVFPELEPRLMMRRCPYCGHESSLSSAVSGERCPRCGADPRIGETRTDASSGDYRMDE